MLKLHYAMASQGGEKGGRSDLLKAGPSHHLSPHAVQRPQSPPPAAAS